MLSKITLANKILLIIITLTLTLLFVAIIIFYVGGEKFISNEGNKTLKFYSGLIEVSLKEELKNSSIELRGLANQISYGNNLQINNLSDEQKQNIKNYILSYPYKYSKILFFRNEAKNIFSATPVKVFSGEVKVSFDNQKPTQLIKNVQNTLTFPKSNMDTVFIPDKSFTNQFLYLFITREGKNALNILALLRDDYLFNKFVNHLALPSNIALTFLDHDGNIYFSTNKKIVNQNINIGIPEVSGSFSNFLRHGKAKFYHDSSGINLFVNLNKFGLIILLQNNLTIQHKLLNKLAGYVLLFSLLIFLIVFGLTKMLTHQLGTSLNQIINVALKVGRGDLKQRINIKRQDEIGLLIDTFNEMIVKLKKNYEALNITNMELEGKIKELVETKNILSKKEKLAIIGETVSKISHEIQNKISGISIWIQNIEYQLQSDETSKMYIDEIKTALNSFLEMLMNFKKFYRTPVLEIGSFDINDLIKYILENYSTAITSKKIELRLNLQSGLPKLIADKKQIEEALINLLINAIYYSPEGKPLEINTSEENGFIKIHFIDYGQGINLKMKDKIFQPFFTTKTDGSGLGLAIVHNIVLAHKGKVNVCNKEKAGACFEIFIPVGKLN